VVAEAPQDLVTAIQALRDAVWTLERDLDAWLVPAASKSEAPQVPSAPPPEPALSTLIADEGSGSVTSETASLPAPPPTSGVGVGREVPGNGHTNSAALSCRLREFRVLAPDGSRSTRFLRANVPFEMRLALDLSQDANPLAFPVACQVTVRARQLGVGAGRIVVGDASHTLVSASETARLACKGLPLAEGVYRLEATAALRGSDGRESGVVFLDGSLVTAV
jgi:hypothetical protein